MALMIVKDVSDVVLGSLILGNGALAGGMPRYTYVRNRLLTAVENLLIGQKLSAYSTGYRAFSRQVLTTVRVNLRSGFVFDNEVLVQWHAKGFRIGEISCPTHYFADAPSIDFRRSVRYGLGCMPVSFRYFAHRTRLRSSVIFAEKSAVDLVVE